MLFVSLECANKGFQNFFMFSDVVDDMFVVQMKEEKGTRILAVQHTRSGDLSWVVWWSCALLCEAAKLGGASTPNQTSLAPATKFQKHLESNGRFLHPKPPKTGAGPSPGQAPAGGVKKKAWANSSELSCTRAEMARACALLI